MSTIISTSTTDTSYIRNRKEYFGLGKSKNTRSNIKQAYLHFHEREKWESTCSEYVSLLYFHLFVLSKFPLNHMHNMKIALT